MILIHSSVDDVYVTPDPLAAIEKAARTCYQSEPNGDPSTFVRGLIKRHHDAMLEFADAVVTITTSRSLANEITRHRHCAFAQSSTRWIDYAKGERIRIVDGTMRGAKRLSESSPVRVAWQTACDAYRAARAGGVPQESARDVLPLATACELVIKANFRQWRHMLSVRRDGSAGRPHPDMVELMTEVGRRLAVMVPEVFDAT